MKFSGFAARFAPRLLAAGVALAWVAAALPAAAYIVIPGVAAAAVNEVQVSTNAELMDAVRAASGPTIIILRPGNYGDVTLRDINPHHDIVLRSLSRSNRATIERLQVRDSSRFRFDSLNIAFSLRDGETSAALAVALRGAHDISFSSCNFLGSQNGTPNDDGRLLSLLTTDRILLFNNYFSEGRIGVGMRDFSRTLLVSNQFRMLREGVNVEAGTDVAIERNYFSNIFPWTEAGDHADAIQVMVGAFGRTTSNLAISDNAIILDRGTAQAIHVRNAASAIRHRNLSFTNNVIYNRVRQGIWISNSDQVRIENNSIVSAPEWLWEPAIYLLEASAVQVRRNIYPMLLIATDATADVTDNVDLHDAKQPVGPLASSQFTGNVTINDPLLSSFRIRSRSDAAGLGAGAVLPSAGVGGVRGGVGTIETAFQLELARLRAMPAPQQLDEAGM